MAGNKKPGSWKVPLAGFGGFILGAATVLLVVYLYGQLSGRQQPARTVAAPSHGRAVPVAYRDAPVPCASRAATDSRELAHRAGHRGHSVGPAGPAARGSDGPGSAGTRPGCREAVAPGHFQGCPEP